ncbi:MAG: GvpL/GvpF family gas vesicle protein [Pseudomonadota bacterium]
MIYLYGLADTGPDRSDLAELTGVTGPVEMAKTGAGWLLFSRAASDDLLPKRRHLLAHTRILETLGESATILPMRFGMFARDLDSVEAMQADSLAQIDAAFNRVRGHVELGIRIDLDRDASLSATLAADRALAREHARLANLSPAPHFEAAAFGRRLAEALDRRRGQAQKTLIATLRDRCADYRLKSPETDVQILAADILLPRTDQSSIAQDLMAAATHVAADFAPESEPKIRLVGPVPPFNFTDLALSQSPKEVA